MRMWSSTACSSGMVGSLRKVAGCELTIHTCMDGSGGLSYGPGFGWVYYYRAVEALRVVKGYFTVYKVGGGGELSADYLCLGVLSCANII